MDCTRQIASCFANNINFPNVVNVPKTVRLTNGLAYGGAGDTAASDSGSRAREGPGEFQRQSLWSIKVKLCRCHKGSEINI